MGLLQVIIHSNVDWSTDNIKHTISSSLPPLGVTQYHCAGAPHQRLQLQSSSPACHGGADTVNWRPPPAPLQVLQLSHMLIVDSAAQWLHYSPGSWLYIHYIPVSLLYIHYIHVSLLYNQLMPPASGGDRTGDCPSPAGVFL